MTKYNNFPYPNNRFQTMVIPNGISTEVEDSTRHADYREVGFIYYAIDLGKFRTYSGTKWTDITGDNPSEVFKMLTITGTESTQNSLIVQHGKAQFMDGLVANSDSSFSNGVEIDQGLVLGKPGDRNDAPLAGVQLDNTTTWAITAEPVDVDTKLVGSIMAGVLSVDVATPVVAGSNQFVFTAPSRRGYFQGSWAAIFTPNTTNAVNVGLVAETTPETDTANALITISTLGGFPSIGIYQWNYIFIGNTITGVDN